MSMELKTLVRKEALKKPCEPRTKLAVRLQTVIGEHGWPVPTVETLEKLISEIRNSKDELDRPWSLVSLPQYSMPPEALPIVLKVWARAIEQDEPLTIREALWVGRLYYMFRIDEVSHENLTKRTGDEDKDLKSFELYGEYSKLRTDSLHNKARLFAINEKLLNYQIKHENGYPQKQEEIVDYWLNDIDLHLKFLEKEGPFSEVGHLEIANSVIEKLGALVRKTSKQEEV